MKSLITIILLISFNSLTAWSVNNQGDVEASRLLVTTGSVQTEWESRRNYEIRRAAVSLNDAMIRYDVIQAGDKISFSLFDNDDYIVTIGRSLRDVNNVHTLTGSIEDTRHGYFILSYDGERVLATIKIVELKKFYRITYDVRTGLHYLTEVNHALMDEIEVAPPLLPEINGLQGTERSKADAIFVDDDPVEIDVMVVYTPAAENWANQNNSGIQNVVAQSMALGQLTIDNSEINLTIRLVYSGAIEEGESGNSYLDLCRLTSTPNFIPPWCAATFDVNDISGYMDEVHQWRDAWGADLVALFTFAHDVGGLGWLLNTTQGQPNYGFSLTRVQQASWTYTHIHELGHNMGKHHSRNQSSSPAPPEGGLFEYSTGWRWTGTDGQGYVSVMTYQEGDLQVPIFSNPDITWAGTPTGSYDPDNQYAPADNARSLREIKDVIANYRHPPGIPQIAVSPESFHEEVNAGEMITRTLTISNLGEGDLTFNLLSQSTGHEITDYNIDMNWNIRADLIPLDVVDWISFNPESGVVGPGIDFEVDLTFDATDLDMGLYYANIVVSNNDPDNPWILLPVELDVTNPLVGVDDYDNIPAVYSLQQNYPNPFNPSTVIRYGLPERSSVKLEIYNTLGQRVTVLVNETQEPGYYSVEWNGRNDAGRSVASGVYLYRIQAGDFTGTMKLIFMK